MLLPVTSRLVKIGVHVMANVDQTSALALTANEKVVNFALDQDILWLAQISMKVISTLDGIGNFIIQMILALLASA
tara:strand:- start:1693 stop:1920 length:228 start_codon:yes stop_codon:yes gene_type:complete